MTDTEKRPPLSEKDEAGQLTLFAEKNAGIGSETGLEREEPPRTSGDIRQASYFVLTIAAVFVINAMESGSYRTPWPVAIVVTVAGLALLVYSLIKSGRENSSA
ncbi:MAG: hypothetical protein ABR523_09280 [Desulfurivibrionaceae bacterium]